MNPLLKYLGRIVAVEIDRPLASRHPKHNFVYEVNYGYVPGTMAPDGDEVDAYLLGELKPVTSGSGRCIAIIHRLDDDDDKLVISATKEDISNEEIERLTHFQEQWFKHEIIRPKEWHAYRSGN